MEGFLSLLALTSVVARKVVFAAAVVMAIVALVDWAVRTRRLSPFGPVARFFRGTVDPLMVPVERRVINAGGLPSSAPFWSLVVVVVGGLLLIFGIDFLIGRVQELAFASRGGGSGLLMLVIRWTFALLRLALIVRVISSWTRISPFSRWIRWSYTLTEWLLQPLRRIIPNLGMIDITPIVAYIALILLESVVVNVVR